MNRLAVLVVTFAAVSSSQAQLNYAKLDVPGATATEARGINNFGEIVGYFKTTTCVDEFVSVPTCHTRGFKYVKGTFIKLMVPNSVSTAIMGVNDLGDLVGFYTKSDRSLHGFIWYHQNVVKTIDFPNPPVAGAPTISFGINKAGVGGGGLWSPGAQYPHNGWKWVNGKFSLMDPFQSGYPPPGACCWSVNGIANNGMMVGQGSRLTSISPGSNKAAISTTSWIFSRETAAAIHSRPGSTILRTLSDLTVADGWPRKSNWVREPGTLAK